MWVDHSLCLTGGGPWQGNALFWLSLILKAWHSQSCCSFDYNFSHLNVCWKLFYPWTAFRWSVMDYLINVLSLIHISQYASSDIILCYERTKARTCLLIREKKWIKASFSSFSATWWLAKTLFWINMSYNTHCIEMLSETEIMVMVVLFSHWPSRHIWLGPLLVQKKWFWGVLWK